MKSRLIIFSSIILALSCISTVLFAPKSLATTLDDQTLDFFDANHIYYYDPCGDSNGDTGSGSPNTVSGDTNEDKIWNYFVSANISGFSDNTAAIAGVMGNLQIESGFKPYDRYNGNYYGIVQWGYLYEGSRTAAADMIDQVTALGNYWHTDSEESKAPTETNNKALEIELNYLTNEDRFKAFLNGLDKTDNRTGEAGAKSYADLFLVEVERAVGGSDTLIDSYAQKRASSSHYQSAAKRRDAAAKIYKKYSQIDTKQSATSGKVAGTGNFDNIMTAKNADKQYSDFDPPGATFSDNDTASMKTLLENYGDLAYQLGRAVGAPYVAVLVQMRYEDSHSVCGKNNFWGNGCPPDTPAGGASIQGQNLGEGFQQYAQTLTNGDHDQALGITDPKTYLEKIGPTWVQGNINGAGYGSINAMKASVDALQAFIDSPEGQAIVKTFGNYTAQSSSAACKGLEDTALAANVGEAASIPDSEREKWLFPDGLPTTESAMQTYLTRIQVPILDKSGKETTMSITVHKKLAAEYTAVFQDMVNAGFKIDPATTAAYNWRNIAGKSKLSNHSYGSAIDVNWNDNPLVYDATTYQPNTTKDFKINDDIVELWRQHGFYWGGCFSSYSDLMHFDYIDKGSSDRYSICKEQ